MIIHSINAVKEQLKSWKLNSFIYECLSPVLINCYLESCIPCKILDHRSKRSKNQKKKLHSFKSSSPVFFGLYLYDYTNSETVKNSLLKKSEFIFFVLINRIWRHTLKHDMTSFILFSNFWQIWPIPDSVHMDFLCKKLWI